MRALSRQASVALVGLRQVGKTTLALQVAQQLEALYVDLEKATHRRQLSEPEIFFHHNRHRLVVLDEVHHHTDVFKVLRSQIDERRRQGRRVGHFLILGSASVELLRQSSESLAGRIEYVQMDALDILELHQKNTLPALQQLNKTDDPRQLDLLQKLWVRGGLPDSLLAASADDSFAFRRNFIQSYLMRDVKQFSPQTPSSVLEKLWTMLAHSQGSIVNIAPLAKALSIAVPTATRYIDLLEHLFLIYRLPPFTKNIKKRLVKSPKIYVSNSGLLHTLLGLKDYNAIVSHPIIGHSWEGFVIDNVLSYTRHEPVRLSFYRTHAGAEVDLILEWPNNKLWAIEIKRQNLPQRGFYEAVKDLQPEQMFVICADAQDNFVKQNLRCLGLVEFLQHLQQHLKSD